MRVSTTTIESFRLWSQPDQDWKTEQSLIDDIRGAFVPTPAVLLGQAFGAVLETPEPYRVQGGYLHSGHFFSDQTMWEPLALMDRSGVYEAKAVKRYPGGIDVVAKADQIVGARLIEHKTTSSTFDFDKYAASCQWRFMVDLFQPAMVTYHVFLLESDRVDGYAVRGIESFNLYPYAGLHEDCCELVRKFSDFVTVRGLVGLLQQRQREAA